MARARTVLFYDDGMAAALAAAGGRSALARRLGLSPQAVKWRTCPRDRVFAVEKASGVAAEVLRPDLDAWIVAERNRRRMAAAASRFSIVAGRAASPRQAAPENAPLPPPGSDDIVAWGVAVAAMQFAATERGLALYTVWRGEGRAALSAKAYAMALAHVAARISSTSVAEVFGTSRQNVENAGLRYLRARDGDDDDDTVDGAGLQVVERGRLRAAKGAAEALWAAEGRFLDGLPGGERKRA